MYNLDVRNPIFTKPGGIIEERWKKSLCNVGVFGCMGDTSLGVHNSDNWNPHFTKLAGLVGERQWELPCNFNISRCLGSQFIGFSMEKRVNKKGNL